MPISTAQLSGLLRPGLFVSFYKIDVPNTRRLILLAIRHRRKNIGKLCLQMDEFLKDYYEQFKSKYTYGPVKKVKYNKRKKWVAKKYGEDMSYMYDGGIPGLERDIDRLIDLYNKRNATRKSKSSVRKLKTSIKKFDKEWASGVLGGYYKKAYERIINEDLQGII